MKNRELSLVTIIILKSYKYHNVFYENVYQF